MECIWNDQLLVLGHSNVAELPEEIIHILQNGSNAQFLETLAKLALRPASTGAIFAAYEPLFVELCTRWLTRIGREYSPLDVVAALARLLPCAPHLSLYAQEIACRRKAGEFAIVNSQDTTGLLELAETDLISLLGTIHRLLQFDNHTFACLVSPAQFQVLLKHTSPCVRYLSIKVLCSFLHASDASFEAMLDRWLGQELPQGVWDGRNINYRFLTLWEEQRLDTLRKQMKETHCSTTPQLKRAREIQTEDISAAAVSFAGVLVPSVETRTPLPSSIVLTPTSIKNLRMIANAVRDTRPLLITGISGSGKTSVIRHISRALNQLGTMLTLHLNEQTDAKLLVGMYTSASTPGSFKWQPGVLTKAVREGRWVLIEDLDRAPPEVIGTLLPLLERNELLVPNLGGWIRASRGFKLIATIRSSLNLRSEEIVPGAAMLGIRHWNKVSLHMLSEVDMGEIVVTRFPLLTAYLPSIMRLRQALGAAGGTTPAPMQSSQTNRSPGPQEILRFCSRLDSLLAAAGIKSAQDPISNVVNDNIFLEAVDCFSASIDSSAVKESTAATIAQELHISAERMQFCLSGRVPFYSVESNKINIGRVSLPKRKGTQSADVKNKQKHKRPFAMTNHALRTMESIGSAVKMKEPCLLVGETGTGKTTVVQELADILGHPLMVVNLSQQSEAGDLLGGFKPVNMRALAMPMKEEFQDLFESTVPSSNNEKFLRSLDRSIRKADWDRTIVLWQEALNKVRASFSKNVSSGGNPKKRRKIDSSKYHHLKARWDDFAGRVGVFKQQSNGDSASFAFSFIEGNIVRAVRSGAWVLLDEINLASPDTLESLADLLSNEIGNAPSLLLSETGDVQRIEAHPDFRIFGAMNPATDVGKRDLPPSIRSRFTEYYIHSPDRDRESLEQVVRAYLGSYVHEDIRAPSDVTKLYIDVRNLEELNQLVDGAEQKPHFSLRTLTRTLTYANDIAPLYGLRRALFEGFSMSFLTLLNKDSASLVAPLIDHHLLREAKNRRAMLSQTPKPPNNGLPYIQFKHYWMAQGFYPIEKQPNYIITPFVESNLLNLIRATSTRRYPVLLQGPTSSGKTSMVEYLAKISGNHFVRINNHEHTDLQEYLGTYVSGPDGLQYQEGILVRALREGHWVVLDELNLAPTDVLEALNRLLDDNRELLIPETQEIVRPHGNFMLFATQNPPGMYGGRKVLSRAFRNRFLELHFDDIPEDELETILVERTQIAPSFCSKIVAVYKKLAILRQSARMFEQKNSFATLRDLFRWALRDADDKEQLAINGFMLLAERVRNPDERLAVKEIIENVMRVKIDISQLYSLSVLEKYGTHKSGKSLKGTIWTPNARRLFVLISRAIRNNEPVLLVGGTGSGKTSICQNIADIAGNKLQILNAHQNTETGDLIGAQRPLRNRSGIEASLTTNLLTLLEVLEPSLDVQSLDLHGMIKAYKSISGDTLQNYPPVIIQDVEQGISKMKTLFEWSDGSLVHAMKTGEHFLLDEISLADDSVLERLNSVLEPSRMLLLAEKGPEGALVRASDGFQFLATMNPGGDYGKKELSPALRNRFTEIWVPPFNAEDILEIVKSKLSIEMELWAAPMVNFSLWFGATFSDTEGLISIREMLAWLDLINNYQSLENDEPYFSILHGAAMVYIDGIGANPSAKRSVTENSISQARQSCLDELSRLFGHNMNEIYNRTPDLELDASTFLAGRFPLKRSKVRYGLLEKEFSLLPTTTRANTIRIARALQLDKPILLEGSPGVGKTTLVAAIARIVGVELTRLNLSDQTDIMDLFGSDVPVEDGVAGQFVWRDAPFLQAMQRGDWVLLDEMNLASQSALEGLNACLDHRGEAYIPELDQRFTKHPEFRVFAAQNPHSQGGGRKGLPASFVNRFTIVYAEALDSDDLLTVSEQLHPKVPKEHVSQMVQCVSALTGIASSTGNLSLIGGPWEFNLRDILRWLHLVDSDQSLLAGAAFSSLWDLLFLQRLRTPGDVSTAVQSISITSVGQTPPHTYFRNLSRSWYQCGFGILPINQLSRSEIEFRGWSGSSILESIMICVQQTWPCLLVGASGSGKTKLLQHLASMVGADLIELPLNAESDTMDIIGGYEQVDHSRKTTQFLQILGTAVKSLLSQNHMDLCSTEPCLQLLQVCRDGGNPNLSYISDVLKSLEKTDAGQNITITELLDLCTTLEQNSYEDTRARFEWVDGVLVQALEQGKWLVLDNANLCSPSVLDRLNSLLEPNGVLTTNEHRSSDGSAKVIKPHPSFRLFLTVDPRHGEISRAMRNRCIELFLPPDYDDAPYMEQGTNESSLFRLRSFQAFDWGHLSIDEFQSLAMVCLEALAITDLPLTLQWYDEVCAGLSSITSGHNALFQRLYEAHMHLTGVETIICQRIHEAYYKISERLGQDLSQSQDFVPSQPIHPLNNAALASTIERHSGPLDKHMWLAEALEARTQLLLMTSAISEIGKLLDQKPQSQLSRLERSMLSKRNLSFARDSTQPLESFLLKCSKSVGAWLDLSVDLDVPEQMFDAVRELVNLLADIFELSKSASINEGYFQSYLAIGRSLAQIPRQNSCTRALGDIIASHLDVFDKSWSMSTGGSMELLWGYFRPSTATSSAHLNVMLEFETLAESFDRLVWRSHASLDLLSKMRASFLLAFKTFDPEQSSSALKAICEALKDEQSRIRESSQSIVPHFQSEFEGIRQYLLFSPQQAVNFPMLDLLAGRSTKQSIKLIGSSPSSTQLSRLIDATGIDVMNNSLATVRQTLPIAIMSRLRIVSETPLGALETIQQEIHSLSNKVANMTDQFSWDHLNMLNRSLCDVHLDLCKSHKDVFDNSSIHSWSGLIRDVQGGSTYTSPRLNISLHSDFIGRSGILQSVEVMSKYLLPSLNYLQDANRDDSYRMFASSAAWISFFIGFLLLYVPDRTFDPALPSVIARERWAKRQAELRNKLFALQKFEVQTTGRDTSLRIYLIEQKIKELGAEPECPVILRPETTQLPQLQGEFASILTSIVHQCPKPDGIEALASGVISSHSELLFIRQNIAQVIGRLSSSYREYDDMVKPVIHMLRGLDVGIALSLVAKEAMQNSKNKPTDTDCGHSYLGVTFGMAIGLRCPPTDRSASASTDRAILALKRLTLEVSTDKKAARQASESIHVAFQTLFEQWKQRLEADQEEHAVNSSLYRYRGSAEDEGVVDEEELGDLFPDYDGENDRKHAVSQPRTPQMMAHTVSDLQTKLFDEGKPGDHDIMELVLELSHEIALKHPSAEHQVSLIGAGQMLPSLIMDLDDTRQKLFEQLDLNTTHNFYENSNLAEARILLTLLRRIQARFIEIQDTWPENATLGDVIQTADELLDFAHTDPLAKIIISVEKLHGYIYEWQTVASREYSAAGLYEGLTTLLINWRRLELGTWARLLVLEDEKCFQDSKSWFFVAYEVIIHSTMAIGDDSLHLTKHIEQLIAELRKFLLSTSYGQYSTRLSLIQRFGKHADLLSEHSHAMLLVRNAIESLVSFHSRFLPAVEDLLRAGRAKLEKDMKEILLLASWKDTNINALRESAKRSHRKLFTIVRKYRGLLGQPVETILRRETPPPLPDSNERNIVIKNHPEIRFDATALDFCQAQLSGWQQKPVRYRDPVATTKIMANHSKLPEPAFDCCLYIESFSTNLITSIKALQKETPSILTKENTDTVKHLKSRKRKVFADTLKDLRMMGFRSNVDTDTLTKQDSPSIILASIGVDSRITTAGANLFSLLDNIEAIRESARTHSDDLSTSDMSRSTGFLESMLSNAVSQNKVSVRSLSELDNFDRLISNFNSLWAPERYQVRLEHNNLSATLASLRSKLIWLQRIVYASCTVLKKHEGMGGPESSLLRLKFQEFIVSCSGLEHKIDMLPHLPAGLTTELHFQACDQAQTLLAQSCRDLESWEQKFPFAKFILSPIKPWAEQGPKDINGLHARANGMQHRSALEFESRVLSLIDSMLVGMQNLKTTLADPIIESSEDPNWLLRTEDGFSKALAVLHILEVTERLEQILEEVQQLDPDEIMVATALCTVALPVISHYREAYVDCVERFVNVHTSTCKLAYVLSRSFKQIVSQGFCSPQEKSNEQSATEKLEDGTGLGEGDGAEDISKDIQDDEDLSELAQEGKKEKGEEEIEEEKDAVDMGHDDLEGDMQDGEEKSDGDDDDNNDQGSDDDEIDEEANDVDDLDPSAVDEKMWDGKGDETEKEKDGNEGQGTKDQEMMAEDDKPNQTKGQESEDERLDEAGAEESEEVKQEEKEHADPHLEQGETLDLPEDMDLDGDKDMDQGSDDADDAEMDAMSNVAESEISEAGELDKEPAESSMKGEGEESDNEEISQDADHAEKTESTVDSENEENEIEDPEHKFLDQNDENLDAENPDTSEAQGAGHSDEQAEDSTQENQGGTRGEEGHQDDSSAKEEVQESTEMGNSGQAPQNSLDNKVQEESGLEKKERQPFQKLGDALETWHRLNKKIQGPTQEERTGQKETPDAANAEQEVEHLPDDDAEADTQALGEATDEQVAALDKDALDSERQQQPQIFLPDSEEGPIDEDQDMEDVFQDRERDQSQEVQPNSSNIVSRIKDETGVQEIDDDSAEIPDEMDNIDTELSTVHLYPDENTLPRSEHEAYALWSHYESLTLPLALSLTESLRLILAPTLASKMRGDFRTGKRLNIKRIIPYIASQYKRDKIWMRRSVPSKRSYQIMLALDDSKSMGEGGSNTGTGKLAFETLALVAKSLAMLEAGELCIVGFGSDVKVAHAFEDPFSSEAGARAFRHFGFQQTTTDVRKLLSTSLELFRNARARANTNSSLWQLQVIISDGICEDHEGIRRLVRQAGEERVMVVFVVVDALRGESIVNMTQAVFEEDGAGETRLRMKRYLDGFPFAYYLIVGDVKELPNVLATALRGWFAEVVESG